MRNKLSIISGILIMLTVVWIEAYVLHKFPYPDWTAIPSFLTAFVAFLGGYGVMLSGCKDKQEMEDK